MARQKKYRMGAPYTSVGSLIYDLRRGRWVYWRDKVMHPGWIRSMTLQTIMGAIEARILREAFKQGEEED
jgi:hypothetical protein